MAPPPRETTASPTRPPTAGYTERLGPPWWLWLAAVALTLFLAAEIWMGAGGVRAWLPFAVLPPAAFAALWRLGRIRVAVHDGALLVDDARLPVTYVADAIALDIEGRREVLGVGADPLAFVVQRPWIGGAVQVVLDDPADPTPYWVVSSRHPVRLAEAILAARGTH